MSTSDMIKTKATNYLNYYRRWTTVVQTLRTNALRVCGCELTLPKQQLLASALLWLTLGMLCVLASGAIAWLGVFGLIDLLRRWSTQATHAMHAAWATGLGVLIVSAGVVSYFVSEAEDETI
jgi:uncharacterized membrane protein YqjE